MEEMTEPQRTEYKDLVMAGYMVMDLDDQLMIIIRKKSAAEDHFKKLQRSYKEKYPEA